MAKGQNLSRYQQSVVKRYYEHKDTIILQKLGEIVSDLYISGGPSSKAEKLWERAASALVNTEVDPVRMGEVLKGRSVEELAKLVSELSNAPAQKSGSIQADKMDAPSRPVAAKADALPGPPARKVGDPPAPEELKRAFKAFRKRLKLSRLDAESKLGRSPLSSGKSSAIVAIQPPNQFSNAVWEELVRQGRLKRAGRGFYQLAEDTSPR